MTIVAKDKINFARLFFRLKRERDSLKRKVVELEQEVRDEAYIRDLRDDDAEYFYVEGGNNV